MPTAVIEAPPGYGKTTAVRDFLKSELACGTSVYWFTAEDEAPTAGFRRLCRGIGRIDDEAGRRLMKIELPDAATVGEAGDVIKAGSEINASAFPSGFITFSRIKRSTWKSAACLEIGPL